MDLVTKLEYLADYMGHFTHVRAYSDMNTILDRFSFMAALQRTHSGCFDPNDELWRVNRHGFIDSLSREAYEYEIYSLKDEIEYYWRKYNETE